MILPLALAAFVQNAADVPRPSLQAGSLRTPLAIDGRLDEADWAAAEVSSELVMIEPVERGKVTGRTEIRVLASEREIAIGIRCFDPEPRRIVSFTKERDGDFDDEDHVVIVLDTFQDGRSGYVFAVNPGGARFDGLISANGEDVDDSWDTIWEAAAARDESGWTAEIRIPILSLSFARALGAWSFNVERRVQRNQETARWAEASRDTSLFQTTRAGLLMGLPKFVLGRGLTVRPAVVGGLDRPTRFSTTRARGDMSVDLSKRLGPNVVSSLTVNTDFAETEADTRQTNLTRFPLLFPEKRAFFLEGSDTFSFGLGLSEDVRPFFSRRIGLVGGKEAPILLGGKISGRIGQTSLGALVVRTRDKDGVAAATTLGAVRVRRNLWTESSFGLIATGGDPLGRSGAGTAGADFTYQTSRFRGDKNALVGLWGVATRRDGLAGSKGAYGVKIDYPNDLWDIAATFRRVGDGFDPSLGFVPRKGVRASRFAATFAPRLHGTFIRQMFHEFFADYVTDLRGRRESYRVFTAPVNWQFESGDRVEVNWAPAGERIDEPFEIADGVVIPPGSYDWTRYRLEVETAAKRRLAGQVTWWFGDFYGGHLDQIEIETAWTPSPLLSFLINAERNIGKLPFGDFDETLLGVKLRLNLSPDLQINSFVQYDNESRSVGTNTRVRWTFRPEGDLFVIYNHNVRDFEETPRGWARESNALLVKAQYSWRR